MAKKRIVGLILSSFIAFGVMLFFDISKKDSGVASVSADELVGTPSVSWNNIDYAGFGPNEVGGVPQEGYCVLAQYPSNISNTLYTTQSLTALNVAGCNVKDHILINGIESQNVEDTIIYCYPYNGIFVYVPQSSVIVGDYIFLTIDILEGTSIDGSAETVATKLEFRGTIGAHGGWQVNPTPAERINGEYNDILWNNIDYSSFAPNKNQNGIPQEGYCVLASFNEEGKTPANSTIGGVLVSGRGVIGKGYNVDYKVKVNGVNLVDVEDSICYIYPQYGLFFYIPDASLTNKNLYPCPTIYMESGVHFNNVFLPELTLQFTGKLGKNGGWERLVNPQELEKKPYSGIATGWNNAHYNNSPIGYNQLILRFGTNGVDYLAENHTADATNRATAAFDIGRKLTINGLPIYKIHNIFTKTHVGYDHGNAFFYIMYPTEVLLSTKDYLVPTLHIEDDTQFMDVRLSEVTLKFAGGSWIQTSNEAYTIDEPLLFSSYSRVVYPHKFGTDPHALLADLPSQGCEIAFNINTGNLDLNANNTLTFDGIYECAIYIQTKTGTIQLADRAGGNATIVQQFTGYMFAPQTDYNFEFAISCGASTTFKFAINHFLVIEYTFNSNKTSNPAIWVHDTSGEFTMDFYEEVRGYLPVIINNGSSHYDFIEGDPAYNFAGVVEAFDLYDDSVSYSNLEFVYEDGAITNGKYNEGTWNLTIKLAVNGYKVITKNITINVHGKNASAKIYYDDGEPIEVVVGSKLTAPTNPKTYREGEYDYVFVGWYFEGAKWDFENDIVQGDMHLYSRFEAHDPHYYVTANFEGLNRKQETYSLTSGSSLPFELFDIEGTTFEVYLGGNKINSLVVNGDATITVRYTVNFIFVPRVEPTMENDRHVAYWYSPVYGDCYFADAQGREIIDDIVLPRLSQNLIDYDPLVKNSDYKLFTINDYSFSGSNSIPLYANNDSIDALSDSFGFRFNINIPNGRESSLSTVHFFGNDINGAGALVSVTLNNGHNRSFLSFNGQIDFETNTSLSLTTNTNHLVEIYFIKTSSSSANILLGVDGEIIWKSEAKNISGLVFNNRLTIAGSENTSSFYTSATDTTSKALNRFGVRKLLSNEIDFNNHVDTGACRGNNGLYNQAKAFYNAYLTDNQKIAFASYDDYSDLRDRLTAWGAANGEALSLDGLTGELVTSLNRMPLTLFGDSYSSSIILIMTFASLIGVSFFTYLIIKRRKINNK